MSVSQVDNFLINNFGRMIDNLLSEIEKFKTPKHYNLVRINFWQIYYDRYGISVPIDLPEKDTFTISYNNLYNERKNEIFDVVQDYDFSSFLKRALKEKFDHFIQKLNRELFQFDNEKAKHAFLTGLHSQLKSILYEIDKQTNIPLKYKTIVIETLNLLVNHFLNYYKLNDNQYKIKDLKVKNELGFNYKFKNTHPENIKDLFQSLINLNLIDGETVYKNFERLFVYKSILKRVLWTGSNSEYYYFIRKIFNHPNFHEINGDIWKTAANCFIVIDKKGREYPTNVIKSWKNPSIKKQESINKIVRI